MTDDGRDASQYDQMRQRGVGRVEQELGQQPHGKQPLQRVQPQTDKAPFLAEDSPGIGRSNVAAAMLTQVDAFHGTTDHQSKRNRTGKVAGQHQQQGQHRHDSLFLTRSKLTQRRCNRVGHAPRVEWREK